MTQTTKQRKTFAKMTKAFRKKEKKDDKGWLSKLQRNKQDTMTSCPHHRLSNKGNSRCVKGGFNNRCCGLNQCDYYTDLKRR